MGKIEDVKYMDLTLKDISANRKVGWFLDKDHRRVKQVLDVATGSTRLVGYLSDEEAKRVRRDLGLPSEQKTNTGASQDETS